MHAWSYAKWEIGIANGAAANCALLLHGSVAFESTQSIVVGMVLSVLLRDRVAARSNSNAASTQRNPADFAESAASSKLPRAQSRADPVRRKNRASRAPRDLWLLAGRRSSVFPTRHVVLAQSHKTQAAENDPLFSGFFSPTLSSDHN